MKAYLFYNPMEIPSKIHLISKKLNIDLEYDPSETYGDPACWMEDLFMLASQADYDDVLIYASSHLGAYSKPSRLNLHGTTVKGWISLKEYRNGGGYLKDHWLGYMDGKYLLPKTK